MTLYPSSSAAGEPPLDQPHYGIGFVPGVLRGFRKYAVFTGRASRSEYWWWVLGVSIVYIVLGTLGLVLGLATSTDRGKTPGAAAWPFLILLFLFGLAVIVPSIALSVRRLHDSGNSGWLYLLTLVPYLGAIMSIVIGTLGTSPNGLRHEPDPAHAVLPPGMSRDGFFSPYAGGYAAPPQGGYGAPPQGGYGPPPPAPSYGPPPGTGYGYPPPPAAPQDQPPPPPYRPEEGSGWGRQP